MAAHVSAFIDETTENLDRGAVQARSFERISDDEMSGEINSAVTDEATPPEKIGRRSGSNVRGASGWSRRAKATETKEPSAPPQSIAEPEDETDKPKRSRGRAKVEADVKSSADNKKSGGGGAGAHRQRDLPKTEKS
ncbi:MAG: hypothetical protein WKF84_03170 [Pyrinomonadaceae bacterium]